MRERKTLWTKNFTIITLGTVISAIGGTAMNLALGLVVFDNTGSSWLTGLFSAVSMLPALLLPVLMAPYLDNHSRKKAIVCLDCAMGLLYLVFGAYVHFAGFSYISYLFFGLLSGSIGAVYSTAYSALYPDLIPDGFIQKGYSISSLIYPTVTVVVSPLAAILYAKLDIKFLFFGEGVLLLVASLFESWIRVEEKQAEKAAKFDGRAYVGQIVEGIRFLKKEGAVRSLYAYMAVTNATGNATTLLTMAYFQSTPGLTTAMYSLLVSADTLGRVVGGLAHYVLKIPKEKRFGVAQLVYKIYNVMDGVLLFLPYWGMLANRFVCGLLGVNSATLRETAVQSYLPVEMRARVNSLLNVALYAGVMLLQMVAGALGELLPYRLVVVLLACVSMSAVYLLIVRNRKAIQPLMAIEKG